MLTNYIIYKYIIWNIELFSLSYMPTMWNNLYLIGSRSNGGLKLSIIQLQWKRVMYSNIFHCEGPRRFPSKYSGGLWAKQLIKQVLCMFAIYQGTSRFAYQNWTIQFGIQNYDAVVLCEVRKKVLNWSCWGHSL